MRITLASTELFVGDPADPAQVLRIEVDRPGPLLVEVTGDGLAGSGRVAAGRTVAEVAVRRVAPPASTAVTGTALPVTVAVRPPDGPATSDTAPAGPDTASGHLVVAEPGWTVWMVPHFHYDPVWWTTQAAYTATWGAPGQLATEFRNDFQRTGLDLVRLHLETARRDPDYRFVLAELDYLKPYWDSHPEDRGLLRRLIHDGRLELMGGTYNEPNTNLVSAESTIRNLVHGAGFQRDILGGQPRTAWQLDVFGHDPQFPGLVADAGLDSSSWARGPFHQWGPMLTTFEPGPGGWGDPSAMQFPSEFEWVSPSGRGVLTHYMPAHYSAGWRIDSQPTLAQAQASVYELFLLLKKVAATRNVLLPVGTDYTPPAKWVTDIHRNWNLRYTWPRFVCALPRQFFAAVRAQLRAEGRALPPQTRDMNPVYTGKDVSYIDTKQAHRHAEALLVDAEKFATVAAGLGAAYPHAAVDRAWRLLVYASHHDAVTGSESDQVYLDLLAGWREAYDLAAEVLDTSLRHLAGTTGGVRLRGTVAGTGDAAAAVARVVVFNPSSWPRTDVVTVRLAFPMPGARGVAVRDGGRELPVLLEHPRTHADGSLAEVDATFLAGDVPAVGYRTFRVSGTAEPAEIGWHQLPAPGTEIRNGTFRLVVDPARGGTVSMLEDLRDGRMVLAPGRTGNELLIYDEYPAHPRFGEGPWHLLPKGGPVTGSATTPAESVTVSACAVGERVTVTGAVGPLRYTQQLTLWRGVDRVDASTHIDEFTGADHLVRLRWPVAVPGALPVSEVAHATIGRGFGIIDVDSEHAPWTLDNPALHWFALSHTARVDVSDLDGTRRHSRAIGVAEIIVAAGHTGDPAVRDLAATLVRRGVSATCSADGGPRYGRLDVDSNLPDVRVAVGGAQTNEFTATLLAVADPGYAAEISRQVAATGRARVWVPASRPLVRAWTPNADLTGPRTLPVLVVAGAGAAEQDAAVADLCADLAAGRVPVAQPAALCADPDPDLAGYTVGLVNRGIPGFAVDTTGALHLSLLRSCTGWPSGIWIDPPRRTAPDGSTFQQQHWSHSFAYALVAGAGDWRAVGLVTQGHDVNHPLLARVFPDIEPSLAAAADADADADRGSDPAREPAPGPAPVPDGGGEARGFLSVEPSGQVVLAALKPAGNPLAGGRTPGGTVGQVTVRLYESTGAPAVAGVSLWAAPTGAREVDLLERPRGGEVPVAGELIRVPLAGAGIGQWTLDVPPAAAVPLAGVVPPAPDIRSAPPERSSGGADPVYARYWLHNTGPAPTGNLPIAVHVEPVHAAVSGPATLTVTVASDRTGGEPTDCRVELIIAEGWHWEPATMRIRLDPGGHAVHAVVVTPPEDLRAGVYLARVRAYHDGQVVEDVARLLAGVTGPERVAARLEPGVLRMPPGGTGAIELHLASDAGTPVPVEAYLISPWHTWDLLPTARVRCEVPARGETAVRLPVRVPPAHRPGRWWALVRLAHAGQLHYTMPVAIEVLR